MYIGKPARASLQLALIPREVNAGVCPDPTPEGDDSDDGSDGGGVIRGIGCAASSNVSMLTAGLVLLGLQTARRRRSHVEFGP
ncbi:MYXO-CTERM sorting domain-containing protein [Myxococcota bacterium]